MDTVVVPGKIGGRIAPPASKSHTIRALLIALAAEGKSKIHNPLDSSDTQACRHAVEALGGKVERKREADGSEFWVVTGIGMAAAKGTATPTASAHGAQKNAQAPAENNPAEPVHIDVGNSGTTLYLAAAVAALLPFPVRFDGDEQIRRRPVGPLLAALSDLGARVRPLLSSEQQSPAAEIHTPFEITGPLSGGRTSIECPTSQYLSALLLAAPLICPGGDGQAGRQSAAGPQNQGISPETAGSRNRPDSENKTVIDVPLLNEVPYVEMTLSWLDRQEIRYNRDEFRQFEIPGCRRYRPFEASIPADFSSASFFLAAAAITGSSLTLAGLDMNDSQGDKAVVSMFEEMGCRVEFREAGFHETEGSELRSPELVISGPDFSCGERLSGGTFDLNATPDALPVMAAAATYAQGETRLINVPQAREKETDRIAVMAEELGRMGAAIEELADGLVIRGADSRMTGTTVEGHDDHRVVMALAVAALAAEGPTTIRGTQAVQVTFPEFFRLFKEIRL
ncbi:MAG: 3-phosphoshikimate 1-carboxyvinyltransferase [Spirochaetales bacterium]|nr:3-phosphoshikimate 1-carboxyvinyltransferase [Spirochaetales bacterium]MCF7937381.1 3-phosphoshikimate 1-carboxyvinyltransferase [Spirochaetales bacterium]